MAKHKPGPWTRLLDAAKRAQACLEADHAILAGGQWDDDYVMQAYEDIECATLDIAESRLNADAAADLLAACEAILAGWESVDPNVQVPDEINDDAAWDALRAAIKKARGA